MENSSIFFKYLLNIILMHRIANDVSVLFEATALGQTVFSSNDAQNINIRTFEKKNRKKIMLLNTISHERIF
jgi:hypothetical protein